MKPLAIELFAGLGGWAKGFIDEGYRVIGFDLYDMPRDLGIPAVCEHPDYLLVRQDVRTLHGAQFKDAAVIVASPPCQFFSRMAMPFKMPWTQEEFERRRNLAHELFWACFRIQHEASEAAGHEVPMVVENVKGAQKWVGASLWALGSYYLWADVPALMPKTIPRKGEGSGRSWFYQNGGNARCASSHSLERRRWTANASVIPYTLAQHVARVYKP